MALKLTVLKKHPLAAAVGAVLVFGVFYIAMNGSGGGSTTVVSNGVDPATAAANAQLAGQQQQIQGQLAGLGIQASTQIQLAQIAAGSDQTSQAYQYQIAQLNAAYETQHDQLAAAVSIGQTQAQLSAIQTQYGALTQQAQISANQNMAAINASTQIAAVNAQTSQIIAGLNSATAQAQAQYGYLSNQAAADANKAAAKAAAGAAKTQSYVSAGLLLASLFCDVNIKGKLGCVSIDACRRVVKNIPLDKFHYLTGSVPHSLGDDRQHVNTYAQDFYREVGVTDWQQRERIEIVDMLGVMLGAMKAQERELARHEETV
jgi:hypothetical protein